MMHISEDLPRLLTGDASREEALSAAAHLRSCPDCQDELISAVLAHAALSSAHRFAPEVVAPKEAAEPTDAAEPPLMPDLAEVFRTARAEAAEPRRPAGRRRLRRGVLVGVAAAAVVAGGATAVVETTGSAPVSSSRSIALAPFGAGTHSATATLSGTTMRVDAAALPKLDAQHFYELWLTDAARKHMQSLGALGDGNRSSLTVSPKVWDEYSAIEVSVQPVDQPAYSGTSVLRGSYR
jgi:hypothetical protein